MKRIILSCACLAMLAQVSCVSDERPLSQTPLGVVRVEIADNAGALTRANDETMNTVRMIVFTDMDTAAPRAEINRLYRAGEFNVETPVGGGAPRVTLTLKLENRPDGVNKKLIACVINEPNTQAMRDALGAVETPGDLDGIPLLMSDFVTANYLSLKQDVGVPMTGALWTDKLFRTEGEASQTGNMLTLEVQRAVARVDVYLKRGADVDPDLKIAAGSTVTLQNTCAAGNLFYHSDGTHTIGSVPTVASFDTGRWSHTGAQPIDISETTPVCAFYTPERTHTANRLTLDVKVVTSEGAVRTGTLTMNSARAGGVDHAVDTILRNHIYKVTVTVGVNDITGDVADWNDINIGTDF